VIWLVLISQRSDSSTADAVPASPPETAMEILDRRLAAGEITIENDAQRRRTLARDVEHSAA
jgi:uncharacterized membrane protein